MKAISLKIFQKVKIPSLSIHGRISESLVPSLQCSESVENVSNRIIRAAASDMRNNIQTVPERREKERVANCSGQKRALVGGHREGTS